MLTIEPNACQQALQLRRIAVARRVLVRRHTVDGGKQSFCRRDGNCTADITQGAIDGNYKAVTAQAAKTTMTRQCRLLW